MNIDISEIAGDFPGFQVAVIVATGLDIPESRPSGLSDFIALAEAAVRNRYNGQALSEIPGIAVWRHAYRRFGIRKTSYRSSVERLVKNTLAGRDLPKVNPFVDAYNAVSLGRILPAGADDLAHVVGNLAFRYSREDDTFHDMGARDGTGKPACTPPKAGEVVYADSGKVLCRRWNWRQDARSIISGETRSAVVTLQDISGAGAEDPGAGNNRLAGAASDLVELIGATCGGDCAITVADRHNPVPELAAPDSGPAGGSLANG